MLTLTSKQTVTVPLPGEQDRVRQMVLYVAQRCEAAKHFSAIKLNKILWKADFDSYAERRVPITGREYRRRPFGPALVEMLPVHRNLLRDGAIRVERRDLGDGVIEQRTIALVEPDLRHFDQADLSYVDAAIRHYWEKTGTEVTDESHGVAWRTRKDNEPMPYELALLSNQPLDQEHLTHVERLIYDKGWISE